MTNCEHLLENGLIAMKEAKKNGEDSYEAFKDMMNMQHNLRMLENVSVTVDELWEFAQYIVYVWEPDVIYEAQIANVDYDDIHPFFQED